MESRTPGTAASLALPVRLPVAGAPPVTVWVIENVVAMLLFAHVIPAALKFGHASPVDDAVIDTVPPLAFHIPT